MKNLTCNGCRAIRRSKGEYKCALGYPIKMVTIGNFFGHEVDEPKPLEDCPKPRKREELQALKGEKLKKAN